MDPQPVDPTGRFRQRRARSLRRRFSLGRTYGVAEVRQQIDAARRAGAAGFMSRHAEGVYTLDALDGP